MSADRAASPTLAVLARVGVSELLRHEVKKSRLKPSISEASCLDALAVAAEAGDLHTFEYILDKLGKTTVSLGGAVAGAPALAAMVGGDTDTISRILDLVTSSQPPAIGEAAIITLLARVASLGRSVVVQRLLAVQSENMAIDKTVTWTRWMKSVMITRMTKASIRGMVTLYPCASAADAVLSM